MGLVHKKGPWLHFVVQLWDLPGIIIRPKGNILAEDVFDITSQLAMISIITLMSCLSEAINDFPIKQI